MAQNLLNAKIAALSEENNKVYMEKVAALT